MGLEAGPAEGGMHTQWVGGDLGDQDFAFLSIMALART